MVMFVNVIWAQYGFIYVTLSTTPYKIIKLLLIVSFDNFLNKYLDQNNMSLKANLLAANSLL